MANCSLLGLLGFVRGLLKLGIGKEACGKAGYSIEPLLPYMGLAEDNLLPQDKFNPIIYLKGKTIGDLSEWSAVKVIYHTAQSLYMSVGLQGSCILFLNPNRFDLTIGGCRRLFQAIAMYYRLLFSYRLPFRSTTNYLTHGNALIYLYLDL
jgi:hypothetical protein